ncbi:MAG: hypothetical protein JWM87_184 [Candidatus Eremiobacteraeota bacterium]|nr:hypothetical protein [Candidatus Eremiobacteraeota bacterium]
MTGGGDLDESEHEVLDESDDVADEADDVEEIDEAGGYGDGEADAPAGATVNINENDPDPTAGASDVGGLPGGLSDDT